MLITYHGDSCVRIAGKQGPQEFTILTDPYDAKRTGLKPLRPSSVDLVCSTTGELPAFADGPAIIRGPGEFEAKSVTVLGIVVGGKIIYRIEAEGVALAHLGNLVDVFDTTLVDRLGDIDILLIPIGGHGVLAAKQASEMIERIEPRVIIPIQYKVAGASLPYDGPEGFCREMGCSVKDAEEKLRIVEKDLPSDEVWVRILAVT